MMVEGIDGAAACPVTQLKNCGKADEIVIVLERAWPPAAVRVGAIGRTANRPEGDPIAAHLDVAAGIAAIHGEFGWCASLQRLIDDFASDADTLAIDAGTGAR